MTLPTDEGRHLSCPAVMTQLHEIKVSPGLSKAMGIVTNTVDRFTEDKLKSRCVADFAKCDELP